MLRPLASIIIVLVGVAACSPPEDPARAQLRSQLAQQDKLTREEVGRVFDEVNRSLQGKEIRTVRDGVVSELVGEEREVVLGMLTDRAGVFDEGLRASGDSLLRVFNAPGRSTNPEIEAVRRLFVDVRTFMPRHFEFAYAFPSPDDYQLDLVME